MIWKISLFLIALALPAAAVECENKTFDNKSFTVCAVDNVTERLRLFLRTPSGQNYGYFHALPDTVTFAMNAGMYHKDRSPVGHYVENGVEYMRIIPNAGAGNFGMLPNGIYCIRNKRADVFETHRFMDQKPHCDHATQSGPMLVIDGQLHPRFFAASDSRKIRNGVGTSDDGTISYFIISNEQVNFHTFARLFRDGLGINNALYFDGRISKLYAPHLNRSDFGLSMGPIVAVED